MIYKKREKCFKLLVLESLNIRTNLSEEIYNQYLKQIKGYEGECYFDALTEELTCDCLILNDLPLEISGTDFQIDTLIITAREILLYEVKNYGGEYLYKDGFLVSIPSGNSFHSPTERINRHNSLLQSLLESLQMKMPIKSFVAFVHPEFMLYDVFNTQKILVQANFPKHFRKLNAQLDTLSTKHLLLTKKICNLSSHTKTYLNGLPEYTYDECTKRIICPNCRQFMPEVQYKNKKSRCKICGYNEQVSTTISRHALEYKRLFPEKN